MGSGKGKTRRVRSARSLQKQEQALILEVLNRPEIAFSSEEIKTRILNSAGRGGRVDILLRESDSLATFNETVDAALEELRSRGLVVLREYPVFAPNTPPGSSSESLWSLKDKAPEEKTVNVDDEKDLVF